jgi:hypothetical protein
MSLLHRLVEAVLVRAPQESTPKKSTTRLIQVANILMLRQELAQLNQGHVNYGY